jgi:RNA polymerase sigma-54 factor
MGMEMKLQFKLQQQLVMTPQLVQAIRLLQLSRLELVDEVRKELDGNPVLADDATDPKAREIGEKLSASAASNEERLESMERSDREKSDLAARETEKRAEAVDWEKLLENRQQQQALPSHRGGFEDLPPIEQNLTKPSNLRDHLVWQLQMSDFVDNERNFAELVIGNLDEQGLPRSQGRRGPDGEKEADLTIEDLAREAGLDPEDAPDVLAMIQRFDPIGVAARDLPSACACRPRCWATTRSRWPSSTTTSTTWSAATSGRSPRR